MCRKRLHLQINDFQFGIEVIITSRIEVSDSNAESVVLHHRLSSVQYVGAQECDRQHEKSSVILEQGD
jgi:hypothetical protein